MDKNLPANAGDRSSIPGLGRFHMLQATKLTCYNCWSLLALGACVPREAAAMWSPNTATKSSPRSLQLEKALEQQQKLSTAKDKWNKYYFVKKRNRHHPEHEQKDNKPWTRCTPSPIREMQIKTTMRHHLTPSRMTATDKTENNKC